MDTHTKNWGPKNTRHMPLRLFLAASSLLLVTACRTTPMTQKLLEGSVPVEAGKYWTTTFTVDHSMTGPRISGQFRASGGQGNDIVAVVADSDQFENWINGHPATVVYESGQVTFGSIDKILVPGKYTLGFSNKFSVISDKTVSGSVELRYEVSR